MKWLKSEHHQMVATLSKNGPQIAEDLTQQGADLMGVLFERFIELCEIMDAVKKLAIYNKLDAHPRTPPEVILSANNFRESRLVKDFNPKELELLHHSFALAGKLGEFIEPIYKALYHQSPMDWENIIEEGGDNEFYFEGTRQALQALLPPDKIKQGMSITRNAFLEGNCKKLSVRYGAGGYSNEQANERADKKEPVQQELDL